MKRLLIFALLLCLFGGCAKPKAPFCRVVTGIEVEYTQGEDTMYRSYTKTASIQSVLTYLRILRPFGPVIPKADADAHCRIILHYSHGADTEYVQLGTSYLQRDQGDWAQIDDARASLLYPLLYLLPSDTV